MKWLPARAYDNAVYVVFSNPIGMDYTEVKNGCSMILDPFGDIVAECRALGDERRRHIKIPPGIHVECVFPEGLFLMRFIVYGIQYPV